MHVYLYLHFANGISDTLALFEKKTCLKKGIRSQSTTEYASYEARFSRRLVNFSAKVNRLFILLLARYARSPRAYRATK